MIGMTERHVALREAEPIPDPIELGAGLGEQTATALEPADGLFDEREQDQALCPPEDVADFGASLDRLEQGRPRPAMIAEQVVDLAEHHFGVGSARGVPDANVAFERLNDHRAAPRRLPEIARDVPEQPERRCLVSHVAGLLERATCRLGFGARLVETASIAERLAAP